MHEPHRKRQGILQNKEWIYERELRKELCLLWYDNWASICLHVVEATHADRLAKLTLLVPLVQYFANVWTHEINAVYSIDIFSSLIIIV